MESLDLYELSGWEFEGILRENTGNSAGNPMFDNSNSRVGTIFLHDSMGEDYISLVYNSRVRNIYTRHSCG